MLWLVLAAMVVSSTFVLVGLSFRSLLPAFFPDSMFINLAFSPVWVGGSCGSLKPLRLISPVCVCLVFYGFSLDEWSRVEVQEGRDIVDIFALHAAAETGPRQPGRGLGREAQYLRCL